MLKALTVRKVPKHSTIAQSGIDSRKFATGLHMPISMHKTTMMEAAINAPSTDEEETNQITQDAQHKEFKIACK
jgi:hypothetical protein